MTAASLSRRDRREALGGEIRAVRERTCDSVPRRERDGHIRVLSHLAARQPTAIADRRCLDPDEGLS